MAATPFEPGMIVEATDVMLGELDNIIVDAQGEPAYLVVKVDGDNNLLTLPVEFVVYNPAVTSKVQLTITQAQAYQQAVNAGSQKRTQPNPLPQSSNDGELRIPLMEERLSVATQAVEIGNVHIQKLVEQTLEKLQVAVTHDEIEVKHVPVNQQVSAPQESRQEGEWLIIPIMKETLVVEKRLVVVEEVHIRRRQVTEQQEVQGEVRNERLKIEDTSGRKQINTSTKP